MAVRLDPSPVALHAVGAGVQGQVGDLKHARPRQVVGPARQRAQPRQQLLEGERLDEVVVGAGVEAGDAVVDAIAGGEHEDRGLRATGPELAAHGEAVQLGQEQVEDDDVEGDAARPIECLAPRDGDVHGVALFLKAALDVRGDAPLVFDDEDVHAPPLVVAGTTSLRGRHEAHMKAK